MTDPFDEFVKTYKHLREVLSLYCHAEKFGHTTIDHQKMSPEDILSAGVPDHLLAIRDFHCLYISLSEYENGGLIYSLNDAARTREAEAGSSRPWPMTPFSFGINYQDFSIRFPPLNGLIQFTGPNPSEEYRIWFNGLSDDARTVEIEAIHERTAREWSAEVKRALYWQHKLYMDPTVPSNITLGNSEAKHCGLVAEIVHRYGYRDAAPEHWELSLHEKDKIYNRSSIASCKAVSNTASNQPG